MHLAIGVPDLIAFWRRIGGKGNRDLAGTVGVRSSPRAGRWGSSTIPTGYEIELLERAEA